MIIMSISNFYMTCGLPGSGKTQLALDLGKEFGLHVYSSDVIREELYGDVNCQDHNQEVFKELQQLETVKFVGFVNEDKVDGKE